MIFEKGDHVPHWIIQRNEKIPVLFGADVEVTEYEDQITIKYHGDSDECGIKIYNEFFPNEEIEQAKPFHIINLDTPIYEQRKLGG